MSDYASNTPISGPRKLDWKVSWDIGGMSWSHDWGMFYNVPDTDGSLPMRKPTPPSGV